MLISETANLYFAFPEIGYQILLFSNNSIFCFNIFSYIHNFEKILTNKSNKLRIC